MTEQPAAPVPPLEPLPPVGASTRLVLVALSAVVALGLVVAGVLVATDDDPSGNGGTAPVAGCGERITRPVPGPVNHNDSGTITYPDAPPASGEHRSVPASFGRPFYTEDRPEVAALVHNLEHGYTIAWYDETAAQDEAAMAELKEIAFDYQEDGDRFIAAPWRSSDGAPFPDGTHVALTRWSADPDNHLDPSTHDGNWLYCGGVDEDAIEDFFETWPNEASAEPGLY